ncbi:MAG: Rpn family recombination-promoting nuclease/putative transposase [Lachnospiraceae bacterium]|nr:Rpn family recombination-promoting nuclease/putative transposase [Lachnospiraceae bacterium]
MAGKKEKFLSLKTDLVFKELMRNETVRKHFISDVLGIPLEEIKSVRLENTFLSRRSRKEKQGILDVRVLFNDESKINIELQIRYMDRWDKRSIFYLTKMYTEDFSGGEKYDRLKKCIVINILGFAGDPHPGYHKIYQLRDQEGRLYSDLLEIHIIELNKELTGDRLDDWIRLINANSLEELKMIQSRNPGIKTAIEEVRYMNLSKWLRRRYDMYLIAKADQKAFEDTARRIGLEEGLAEGRAKGLAEGRTEGLAEGRAEGRTEGGLEQSRQSIFDLLEEFGDIPEDIRKRINTEDSMETLRRWLKASHQAESFDHFRENMK